VKRSLLASFVGMVAIAATLVLFETKPISAKASTSTAVFDSQGRLKLPAGYRRWVSMGVSLTPNGLNRGEAPFPEFHQVYVEERNLDGYLTTGSFPEGTVLVKELSRVLDPTFPDGSRTEPSGRGYFDSG